MFPGQSRDPDSCPGFKVSPGDQGEIADSVLDPLAGVEGQKAAAIADHLGVLCEYLGVCAGAMPATVALLPVAAVLKAAHILFPGGVIALLGKTRHLVRVVWFCR
jgi:hypothetical protein